MRRTTNQRAQRQSPGPITLLLTNPNDPDSLQTVLQFAYEELHRIAVHHRRQWPEGQSLQPSALLNETCIRFLQKSVRFKNRAHFFGSASRTMRRILIEHSRKRRTRKRGGDWRRVEFAHAERIGFEQPSDLLELDFVLKRLEKLDSELGRLAELRIFGGCSMHELATILRIPEITARRKWAKAKSWLANHISGGRRTVALEKAS